MAQQSGFKICSHCGVNKKHNDYLIRKKNGRETLRAECRDCTNRRRRELYKKINREKILLKNKKWISKNKEYKKEYDKKRQVELRELKNMQKLKNYHERKSEPEFRIKRNLRARLYFAVANNQKYGTTIELIGCEINFLKKYLESKFVDGMNWDNYGKNGWHIDHIIPCCNYNLSDINEQKKCFHYTNLQPLWQSDNCSKGGKINF